MRPGNCASDLRPPGPAPRRLFAPRRLRPFYVATLVNTAAILVTSSTIQPLALAFAALAEGASFRIDQTPRLNSESSLHPPPVRTNGHGLVAIYRERRSTHDRWDAPMPAELQRVEQFVYSIRLAPIFLFPLPGTRRVPGALNVAS